MSRAKEMCAWHVPSLLICPSSLPSLNHRSPFYRKGGGGKGEVGWDRKEL